MAGARTVFSIQVGAFPTAGEAEAERDRFAALYSPVYLWEKQGDTSGYPFKVLLGQFSLYAEAWARKTNFIEDAAPGSFIVQWETSEPVPDSQVLPVRMPFDASGLNPTLTTSALAHWEAVGLVDDGTVDESLTTSTIEALPKDDLLKVATKASLPEKAQAAQDRFLEEFPGDPAANRVRLKKARRVGKTDFDRSLALLDQVEASGNANERAVGALIRAYVIDRKNERLQARELFKALAGNSSLAPSLRRDAMRRVAGISHALQNYPDALLAFEEIERTTDDPAAAAEARMQRAGLAFELVGRGKGSWDEVRTLCESIAAMPGATHQDRATADLMHLETWYNEDQYEQSLEEADAFIAAYSDVVREQAVAQVWKGLSLYRLARTAEARAALEEATATPIPAEEKFAGVEPRARAALWLAHLENGETNLDARDRWVEFLRVEFPSSQEYARALSWFGSPSP